MAANQFIVVYAALLLAAPIQARYVTPVEQVIDLLSGLKTKLTIEGTNEATTYDEFACFCRDTSDQKSNSITSGQSNIESLSASIALDTATKAKKQEDFAKRTADQQQMAADLAAEHAAYAKEKAEYESTSAELNQAISGLTQAIDALERSKPTSFLSVQPSVQTTLDMAEALGFIMPNSQRQQVVTAFLQGAAKVDPASPAYRFHSDNIIQVLKDVLADFTSKKKDVDEEWGRRTTAHNGTVESLEGLMSSNGAAIKQLGIDIKELTSTIASSRKDLIDAKSMLEDDQLYMKDLTERCEHRAKEWDQRSKLRADELTAIAEALDVLREGVQPMDESANERALLQKTEHSQGVSPSFLQGNMQHAAVNPHNRRLRKQGSGSSLLERRVAGAAQSESTRKQKALTMLATRGQKMDSAVLTSLVSRASDDPFLKVKGLIQQLIERLLKESAAEATKKGFCDTEVAKAEQQRDYRSAEVKALVHELYLLKTKKEELAQEIDTLNASVIQLDATLDNATTLRGEEKQENSITVSEAKAGLVAVNKAIEILQGFYKEAAKAKVLIQKKASPVDEDTAGAGFKGAYKGQQESATGIIGLLQVIKSDFERTIRNTKTSEKEAAAEFVLFDRASKADIGGKSTKIELNTADHETTATKIAKKFADLQTAQDLLDEALMEIEKLMPMCIDTTMPYAERVQKREDEIAALKSALCILDPEHVEPECPDACDD